MKNMTIKAKLTLAIGVLVSMIVLLVVLSIANLQILTATDPDSPAAGPGLKQGTYLCFGSRRYLYSYRYRHSYPYSHIYQ